MLTKIVKTGVYKSYEPSRVDELYLAEPLMRSMRTPIFLGSEAGSDEDESDDD